MKIRYAAPSYRRPQKSSTQTLFPFVDLVVAESEAGAYKANGNRVIVAPDTAQGNLCRIRNWMLDNLMDGYDCLIILDDDYQGVGIWEKQKKVKLDAESLEEFCESMAILCRDFGFYFWGLNCVPDKGAYREYTPFGTLQYIGGPFQAHMAGTSLRYDENLPLKEDYDLTLQHILEYGGCLRANFAFYEVKQAEQAGGCATYRNVKKEKQQMEALQRKWGSDVVKYDKSSKRKFDFNPILKVPIKGV